jgi:hypothetical protein
MSWWAEQCAAGTNILWTSLTSHKVKTTSNTETSDTELLLTLANTVILGTGSCRNHDYILLSQDSQSCHPVCPQSKLLLVLASRVILSYESCRIQDHILLSHIFESHESPFIMPSWLPDLYFPPPHNRPWRTIQLWDVEAPTFSRQLAHRWWG